MNKPLEDILIIDFSQFLSGPSASLRLADLGARVIKIERPFTGDICRELYVSNVVMNGDSSVFHAINRNKQSFVADLKKTGDAQMIRELLEQADVVMHNFRPGVMERLGFSYNDVKQINKDVIYAEISGYGTEGPYLEKPGQDLLVQAISGLTWLSGNDQKGPVPFGLALVDILAGTQLVQGILACLLRKSVSGKGGLVQVSMLETAIDFQFETITTFFRDGGQPTVRAQKNSAHAYLGAPYGIYQTKNGYLALAMSSIPQLGQLLNCEPLLNYPDDRTWYTHRDEIKTILSSLLMKNTLQHWLSILEPNDIWCSEVMSWDKLFAHEGFKALDMIQSVHMSDGFTFQTTRCPIRIDGELFTSELGTPILGEHNLEITKQLIVRSYAEDK